MSDSIRLLMTRLLMIAIIWPAAATPAQSSDEGSLSPQAEAWLHESDNAVPQARAGELLFLTAPPAGHTLHSRNTLTLDAESLSDGWVQLEQCYDGLDAVPDAEIVYRYRDLRDLRIASQRNIGRATVDGKSVQLSDVRHDATLCVRLRARILYAGPRGHYLLRNGPFNRRFLDGYFPLHVTLDVSFPPAMLNYAGIDPQAQPGFAVTTGPGAVAIDSWFAGTLNIEITFTTAAERDPE